PARRFRRSTLPPRSFEIMARGKIHVSVKSYTIIILYDHYGESCLARDRGDAGLDRCRGTPSGQTRAEIGTEGVEADAARSIVRIQLFPAFRFVALTDFFFGVAACSVASLSAARRIARA